MQDFTTNEVFLDGRSICKFFFGFDDADLAADFGSPQNLDSTATARGSAEHRRRVDGTRVNGFAPDVTLVALKISQWCGSAYDSEIIAAFSVPPTTGSTSSASRSAGSWTERPGEDLIYQLYVAATTRRASARRLSPPPATSTCAVGAGGEVLTPWRPPSMPPVRLDDLLGQYEIPGGIPGSRRRRLSTGNIVNASSPSCSPSRPPHNSGFETCKPSSGPPPAVRRRHFATNSPTTRTTARGSTSPHPAERRNSTCRPQIAAARPAGRGPASTLPPVSGGTSVAPTELYKRLAGLQHHVQLRDRDPLLHAPEPSPVRPRPGTPSLPPPSSSPPSATPTIQGTSMATPHASAVLALIASANPNARQPIRRSSSGS